MPQLWRSPLRNKLPLELPGPLPSLDRPSWERGWAQFPNAFAQVPLARKGVRKCAVPAPFLSWGQQGTERWTWVWSAPDPPPAPAVRPLGLVAGLAGHHHPGFPESLPQLPPGGPARKPDPREGAAAGQAWPPRRLPGGEERRHLGAARAPRAPSFPRGTGPVLGECLGAPLRPHALHVPPRPV